MKTLIFSQFLLVSLLLLSVLPSLAFPALSDLGGECRYSGECREGFCLNLTCRFPTILERYDTTGNCSYTAECVAGFCKDGQCILPLREEFEILSFGAKSGCAGVVDNCTGILCAFCSVTWILLFVGSAIAAFVGRRRGRVLPALLFLLPMFSGLVLLPVIGLLLVLIEIFILAVLKKRFVRFKR